MMMQYTTMGALGQDRLAKLHRQAERDALRRAAQRQRSTRPLTGLRAAFTGWARRREPAPEACDGPSSVLTMQGGSAGIS
jgi:hypothetical protein